MAFKDWMANYQNRRLAEVHMPGAHDAGTMRDKIELVGTAASVSNSVTQDLSIRDQLRAGTRFFDLRLKVRNDKVVAHHTTAGVGAYGTTSFDDTIQQVDRWCARHPTEVVILRISHTSTDTNVSRIIRSSVARNGNRGGKLHTGTGNLCTKTLGEITGAGGGLVCILEEKTFGASINQAQGIHAFSKWQNGGANARGISVCGCFEGSHKLEKVITNGLTGSYEHNQFHNSQDHLWQVYWQKTYFNPWHGTGIHLGAKKEATFSKGKMHGGTHAATSHMIHLMNGENLRGEDYVVGKQGRREVTWSTVQSRNFLLPNIISYDFVNETTNALIIELNKRARLAHPNDDDDTQLPAPVPSLAAE
ncbi:MAG: hypothetical protein AAF899_15785 [Pseudomonadota bacterium]